MIAILMLGLYIGGAFGKKKDEVVVSPSVDVRTPEIVDGMTFDEFRAYLAVTYVGSFTETDFEYDNDTGALTGSKITYVTTHGSLVENYDKDGNRVEYTLRFIEDGRAYERIVKSGEEPTTRIVDLEGATIIPIGTSFAPGLKTSMEMIFALASMSNLDGVQYGNFDIAFTGFNVKDNIVKFQNGNGDEYLTMKDFNKTEIPVPEDFKDYKTTESTEKLGKYRTVTDVEGNKTAYLEGLNKVFNIALFNVQIKQFEVKAEYDGAPVVSVSLDESVKDLIVPASVNKISGGGRLNDLRSLTYRGTLAQWAEVNVESYNLRNNIPVHCTDGETEILPRVDA